MRSCFVIGGMNMDIIGGPSGPLVLRDSNPGKVLLRPGGVGRNMAAALAQLGVEVELIAPLGADAFAPALEEHCRQAGVGLRYAPRLDGPSGVYLCLHDETGDMLCAINQMEGMERLTPERLQPLFPIVSQAPLVLLDANLTQESLEAIAAQVKAPLLLDPVSCAKAKKALPVLHRLRAIKPNRYEAQTLTGIPCDTPQGVAAAASRLLEQGVQRVYISLGQEGIYYADQAQAGYVRPQAGPWQADFTGAGDRVMARLALGELQGWDIAAIAAATQQPWPK